MIPELFLSEFELLMDSLAPGGTGYLQSTGKPLASRVCACGMGCVETILVLAHWQKTLWVPMLWVVGLAVHWTPTNLKNFLNLYQRIQFGQLF